MGEGVERSVEEGGRGAVDVKVRIQRKRLRVKKDIHNLTQEEGRGRGAQRAHKEGSYVHNKVKDNQGFINVKYT